MAFDLQTLGRLAPTAGGILGGIGGELVDPFGGGIAGAGLGSALGKGFENYTQGQSPIQMNDVAAGAEGAAGQAAGGLVGGLLGKVGQAFGGIGGKMAENAGVRTAMGGLTTAEKEGLNVDNSVNLAKKIGLDFTNPDQVTQDMANMRDLATGTTQASGISGGGLLNGTLDQIVGDTFRKQGTGIDLGDYGKQADNFIAGQSKLSSEPTTYGRGGQPRLPGQVATIKSNLNNALQQFGFGGEGSLNSQADPIQALDLQRTLYDMAKNETSAPAAKVYQQMAKYVQSKVYTPEVNAAVKAFSTDPETTSRVLADSNKLFGNTQPGQFLLDTLNNASKASDITDVERQLIDMGEAGKAATSRNAAKALGAPSPLEEATGHLTSGNKAGAAGALLKGASVSGKTASGVGNLLERMSPFTANGRTNVLNKLPGALGALVGTSPNAAAPGGGSMQPTAATQQTGMPPILNTYDTLAGMMTLDPYLTGSLAGPLSQIAPLAQKTQAAQAELPAVEQAYQAAGGGQGPFLGNLARLGGLLGVGPAATYQRQAQALQSLLAQIGMTGAYLPSLTQAPQSGALGFGQLQAGLNSAPLLSQI